MASPPVCDHALRTKGADVVRGGIGVGRGRAVRLPEAGGLTGRRPVGDGLVRARSEWPEAFFRAAPVSGNLPL